MMPPFKRIRVKIYLAIFGIVTDIFSFLICILHTYVKAKNNVNFENCVKLVMFNSQIAWWWCKQKLTRTPKQTYTLTPKVCFFLVCIRVSKENSGYNCICIFWCFVVLMHKRKRKKENVDVPSLFEHDLKLPNHSAMNSVALLLLHFLLEFQIPKNKKTRKENVYVTLIKWHGVRC